MDILGGWRDRPVGLITFYHVMDDLSTLGSGCQAAQV
jgi:hypothetical protein